MKQCDTYYKSYVGVKYIGIFNTCLDAGAAAIAYQHKNSKYKNEPVVVEKVKVLESEVTIAMDERHV
jgi:hypothetical protein